MNTSYKIYNTIILKMDEASKSDKISVICEHSRDFKILRKM